LYFLFLIGPQHKACDHGREVAEYWNYRLPDIARTVGHLYERLGLETVSEIIPMLISFGSTETGSQWPNLYHHSSSIRARS
jgi:hypothetical protein